MVRKEAAMALTPVLLLLLAYCLSGVSSSAGPPPRSFTSLFALGDSYIDAGNFVTMATPVAPVWVDKPPYGMTFFERPTGRFSDSSNARRGASATEGSS
jgi:hypothetical protein